VAVAPPVPAEMGLMPLLQREARTLAAEVMEVTAERIIATDLWVYILAVAVAGQGTTRELPPK